MAVLKFWTDNKKETGENQASDSAQAAPWTKLEPVQPRRRIPLGRHLAFSIEENAIQMAVASHYGTRCHLRKVLKVYVPRDIQDNIRKQDFITDHISDFVAEYGGRQPTISITIDGPDTAMRTIQLPDMKREELASAIAFETKRQIPFSIDDCYWDYRVITKIATGEKKHLEIAVLAATRQLVQERLAPFNRLGLKVTYIYHSQDVIGQLLRSLPHFDNNASYALINVQRERSAISYYHGANLEYFHISSLGSSFLGNRSDPTVFEYFAESLATEIQNSLDYYGGQYSSRFSNQVYIYGDLAYSSDLIDLLTDRFGFSFQRFPAEQVPSIKATGLSFEETIPVCLSSAAAATNPLALANLLPTEDKLKQQRRRTDTIGITALITISLLLAGQWGASVASDNRSREHLAELKQQIEEFRESEIYATYNQLKGKIAVSRSFLEQVKETPSLLGYSLKELSRITPQPVRLQSLSFQSDMQGRNLHMSGLVTTTETPPELVLAEFVEKLTASHFYEDVTIDRHIKKVLADRFEIEFQLSMRGVV